MLKITNEDLQNKILELQDRLKTLEDMVKFIMKNTPTALHPSHKPEFSLQDLWDERFIKEYHDKVGDAIMNEYIGEPTVKERYCKGIKEIKFNPPVEIETGVEYEVKTNVKEYPCKCDCHNKMTKEELYPDNKPIANCGLCCLDESTVKECDCDCHNNIAHHIDERCKCMPYNKSEKIEEELGTLITGDYAYGHKMSEEEWDKFNKMRKDKKIEEIIDKFKEEFSGLRYFLNNSKTNITFLDEIESWLRDKLKELCK